MNSRQLGRGGVLKVAQIFAEHGAVELWPKSPPQSEDLIKIERLKNETWCHQLLCDLQQRRMVWWMRRLVLHHQSTSRRHRSDHIMERGRSEERRVGKGCRSRW